ncbi:MAG: hypothetical protein ONB44_21510 [candidate division KSB1 bacterium]|nr:hypothetical protein [candidate division KSB1 bacterium]MDZ7304714.1 hypothetical protein [candidate division KSB1 bacterium]MDZ7312770.1 hypothetical protein [candidate division KSB1 bacterium]
MKQSTSFLTLLLAAISASSVAPQITTRLEPFGLQGERITALRFSPQFGPSRYNLYATTYGNGVYRHDPPRSDSLWLRLGLYDKKITALDIQVWGVGPAIFHAPVVGVAPDYEHGDSTLIYRLENERWVPADSGIMKSSSITSLASFASSGHEPPGATFAVGGSLIYRSNSLSHWWTEINNFGLGWYIYVTAVSQSYGRDEVWIGGIQEGAIAWIAKSINQGETWETFYPPSLVLDDNAYHSLAIHPDSSDIVYAGMCGVVIKTDDGGKTWQITDLQNNRTYIYGLALDSFDPNHVYAGGTAANQWALWESFNGGTKWQAIPAPQSVWNIQGISSLVADPNAPGVVYIGTLGGGVWRYQSGVVAVQDRHEEALPQDFVLEQNHPNPFNACTSIRFEIPPALANASARLAIYSLRGELVRELINRSRLAGNYFARWDGRNDAGNEVASGIYICQLKIGKTTQVRKMSFLK